MLALSEQEAEILYPRRVSSRFPEFRPTKKKLFGLRKPSRTENRSNKVMKSASACVVSSGPRRPPSKR
jgi:hypothetical protein